MRIFKEIKPQIYTSTTKEGCIEQFTKQNNKIYIEQRPYVIKGNKVVWTGIGIWMERHLPGMGANTILGVNFQKVKAKTGVRAKQWTVYVYTFTQQDLKFANSHIVQGVRTFRISSNIEL
jgi:hypothetical protein